MSYLDIITLLLDKYEPHEVVEKLEAVVDGVVLLGHLEFLILEQLCEGGAFEDEWRELHE
jgi:hypothetical protein